MLPAFFYSFSKIKVDEESREVSYRKRLLWIFPAKTVSMSIPEGDWSIYRNRRLIVNGQVERVPSKLMNDFREVMNRYDNNESPLYYSDRFIRRLFWSKILQFGHKGLYIANTKAQVTGNRKFHYTQLTFNKAHLTNTSHHILLNEYALAYEKEKVEEIFNVLKKTVSYEGQLFFDKIYSTRKKYLLLGKENCYAESLGTRISDIVYFDRSDRFRVKLDFGNAAHFYYRNFGAEPADYVYNYFLECGAPIKIKGTVFKSKWVLINLSSIFFKSTITLGEEGVHYSRPVGWKKFKTSFIPYRDFYFVKLRGLFFFWSKIEAYGSQNVLPSQYFRSSAAKLFRKTLYEKNPSIAKRTGQRFRTFRWIPFAPKETVLVTGSRVMYYHPKTNAPICIKAPQLKDSVKFRDKGFWNWLLWRNVVTDFELGNLRYDETTIDVAKLYNLSVENYNIETDRLPEKHKNDLLSSRFLVPHMWRCSASRLVSAINSAKYYTDDDEVEEYDYKSIYLHDDTDDPFHIFTRDKVFINGVVKSDEDALADDVTSETNEKYTPSKEDIDAEDVKFNLRDFVMQHKVAVIAVAVILFWWGASELLPLMAYKALSYSTYEETVSNEGMISDSYDSTMSDEFAEDNEELMIDEISSTDEVSDDETVFDSGQMEQAARLVFAMVLPQGVQSDDFEEIVVAKCTPSFIDALKSANDFEDGSIAWWALRTMEQEGPADSSEVISLTPDGDDAVIVNYSDMGHKASTRLEFIKVGDECKVNSATVTYNGKNRTIK